MRRDIVDLLVANPDGAAVIDRVEILLAGAQHGGPPEAWRRIYLRLFERRQPLAYARGRA
jgi:hypothetical protein